MSIFRIFPYFLKPRHQRRNLAVVLFPQMRRQLTTPTSVDRAAAISGQPLPLVRLDDRSVIVVRGPDVKKFLQGFLTNDILKLQAGQSLYAAALTSKGRILFDGHITSLLQNGEETFLIDVQSAMVEIAHKQMRRYKLRSKVDIFHDSELVVYAAVPKYPTTADEQDQLLAEEALSPLTSLEQNFKDYLEITTSETLAVTSDSRLPWLGYRGIGRRLASNASSQMHKSSSIEGDSGRGLREYHKRRLLLGVCEGTEISERIVQECNIELLHGVSFSKGCYVGQELVARTQFKGAIRKRLLPLIFCSLDSPALPPRDNLPDWQYLKEAIKPTDSYSPAVSNCDVVEEFSGKKVGSIICSGGNSTLGVGMLRVDTLLASLKNGSRLVVRSKSEVTGEQFEAVVAPLRPAWYSRLDLSTGKLRIEN